MSRVQRTYSLSPMQEGMLYHHLANSTSGVDIQQIVARLNEPLDPELFARAWSAVLDRNETLRTRFRWKDVPHAVQEVCEADTIPFVFEDWRGLDAVQSQQRLADFLRDDRSHGFDLATAPLTRLALFQTADNAFTLVWTVHHIVLDGRSYPLVLADAFAHYEALCRNDEPDARVRPPFKAFIDWLRQRDHSADGPWWRRQLEGVTAPTPLPLAQTLAGSNQLGQELAEKSVHLSSETTAALQAFAAEHSLTVNTLVQGAWAVLLRLYSGEHDVVFGTTRACRGQTVDGAENMTGMCINTLPLRVHVDPDRPVLEWLAELRRKNIALREHEHTPLSDIKRLSDVPAGESLFDSAIVFDHYDLNTVMQSQGGPWLKREFKLVEKTPFPLTVYAHVVKSPERDERKLHLKIAYAVDRFDQQSIGRLLAHFQCALEQFLAAPQRRLSEISVLTHTEQRCLLEQWNDTATSLPEAVSVHQLIEEQARRSPDAVALCYRDEQYTYGRLNARANQIARFLQAGGITRGTRVGICMNRSANMVTTLLGIHKAGAAYVPLDPEFPADRLAFLIHDARIAVLLTERALLARLPSGDALTTLCVDELPASIDEHDDSNLSGPSNLDDLAYVIYTSGSTGKPKGVMVEHGNVINFFAGMDRVVPHDPPGVWLAVTSLSFDISVLELFWTLTHGFTVVLQPDGDPAQAVSGNGAATNGRNIDFSLFYFASAESGRNGRMYDLFLNGARFADDAGFSAVWAPERHFHAFGGIYPNPSVTGAALAAVTRRIGIRAGSVVLPLHNPIRVAEEWAVVDNLSKGRVAISFASGWQSDDFVLAPQNYADRKKVMLREIDTVRRLWRGETAPFTGVSGEPVSIRTLPRPVQAELPFWLTCAGNVESFRIAGEIGANLLTHLLGQTPGELEERILTYRRARADAGHDPATGTVTVMLHTFVGDDEEAVRATVREPLKQYLNSSVGLMQKVVSSFPAFKHRSRDTATDPSTYFKALSPTEREALLDHAFERYFETAGLFGTPQSCQEMVERMRLIGADEIACLIDFGIDPETTLRHLHQLNTLREQTTHAAHRAAGDDSIAAQLRRHGVTHMQCTPSMARMLLLDPATRHALRSVRHLFVGGETLPADLARELRGLVAGDVVNMYGPTETTVWSATYTLDGDTEPVPIGRPIANTQLYILDKQLQPVPVGVAGELYIGGRGVARGYLERPELTAERFIADPFRDEPRARLYRTGDLARYRPDGNIEFLGRTDHQVKCRGHRIELGEIEAALAQHPTVRQAVVVAKQHEPGDTRLVAYVVAEQKVSVKQRDLRHSLESKLPPYMVPAQFVVLDRLPTTPNKKIDRNALVALDDAQPLRDAGPVGPRNDVEQLLVELWSEVLGVEQVGIDDDFTMLGGDSLSAIELFFKIQQRFEVEFPLSCFFERPTVAAFAEELKNLLARSGTGAVTGDAPLPETVPTQPG